MTLAVDLGRKAAKQTNKEISLDKYVNIISFFFMGLLCGTHMGPIWTARIWDNPYVTHVEPGCTPNMGPIWVAHVGPIYACLLGTWSFSDFRCWLSVRIL